MEQVCLLPMRCETPTETEKHTRDPDGKRPQALFSRARTEYTLIWTVRGD